jgi:hypothetical protein
MKSFVQYNGVFSCSKKATKGSSFWNVEKPILQTNLKWKAGNGFKN